MDDYKSNWITNCQLDFIGQIMTHKMQVQLNKFLNCQKLEIKLKLCISSLSKRLITQNASLCNQSKINLNLQHYVKRFHIFHWLQFVSDIVIYLKELNLVSFNLFGLFCPLHKEKSCKRSSYYEKYDSEQIHYSFIWFVVGIA